MHARATQQIGLADGSSALALLPTKFRKLVWIKRGMFLIVSFSDKTFQTAAGREGRVKYMIEHILLDEQEAALRKSKFWPDAFRGDKKKADGGSVAPATGETGRRTNVAPKNATATVAGKVKEEDDDYMSGVFKNTNRSGAFDSDLSSSSDEDDD